MMTQNREGVDSHAKNLRQKGTAGLMYSYREGHISPGNTVSLYTVHCRAGVAITIIDILLL